MNAKEFLELKETVARLNKNYDRSQGALSQLKARLPKGTVKEAEKKRKKMNEEIDRLEKEFENELETFETEFAEHLPRDS